MRLTRNWMAACDIDGVVYASKFFFVCVVFVVFV
jgi:hypothetical protein